MLKILDSIIKIMMNLWFFFYYHIKLFVCTKVLFHILIVLFLDVKTSSHLSHGNVGYFFFLSLSPT